jgi:hypothetical protein
MMIALLALGCVAVVVGGLVVGLRRQLDAWNESAAKRLPYRREGVSGNEHESDRLLRWIAAGSVVVIGGIAAIVAAFLVGHS